MNKLNNTCMSKLCWTRIPCSFTLSTTSQVGSIPPVWQLRKQSLRCCDLFWVIKLVSGEAELETRSLVYTSLGSCPTGQPLVDSYFLPPAFLNELTLTFLPVHHELHLFISHPLAIFCLAYSTFICPVSSCHFISETVNTCSPSSFDPEQFSPPLQIYSKSFAMSW